MSLVIRTGMAASIHALANLGACQLARRASSRTAGRLLLTLCIATAALTAVARAEVVQIPAIAFVNRAGAAGLVIGDATGGTLTNAAGTFYAPVPFPTDGVVVCRFFLVHRDGDAEGDVTARLMRKKIVVGGNPFTDGLMEMARVQTTGGTAVIAKKRDISIKQPIVNLLNSFYYVELTIDNNFIEVLGVQIVYGPSC